jgi:flagellar biogenesis protein FliO
MEVTQTQSPTRTQANSPLERAVERASTLAAARLKVLWRSAGFRASGKRKTLWVRETAALGDRRFVSVIQFERQRFLIAACVSSVTLLAQLPDEPAVTEPGGEGD